MIRLDKKFIRKDIDTYKPKYKLYCKEVKFEVKRNERNK